MQIVKKDENMDEVRREKLREINRSRLIDVAICIAGIAFGIGGLIAYLPTDTRVKYELPPQVLETYHPYETVAIVLWVIGGVLLVSGIAGIYYFTKNHAEILNSMDDSY